MSKEFKGIYTGDVLSNDEYHGEKDHNSSSNLKQLLKDPALYYKEKILNQKEIKELACFSEGSLVHGMILEEHLVNEEFAKYEGMRKIGKDWDRFKAAEKAGKNRTILSKPQWIRCENLVKGYKLNKTAVKMVDSCDKEFSLFLELQNVKCKVRADLINIDEGYIADIKTTSYDTDVDQFKFTIKDFSYELSAAFYCAAFEEHYGKPFDFYWIVLGKRDRSCEIYKMSKDLRGKGDRMVNKALGLYKQCKESGIWKLEKKSLKVKEYENYEILEI